MNNENENILSKLNKVPVQVPNDDFFESLKVHVVDKINNQTKIVPLYKRISFRAAAAVLILITIGTVYFTKNTTKEVPKTQVAKVDFKSVSREDILAYIEENHEEFETEDIASVLSEIPTIKEEEPKSNDIAEKASKPKSHSTEKLWNELKDEDILRYLEDQGEDLDEDLILGS